VPHRWVAWGAVGVDGRSMLPTLAPGDACLVRWGAAPRAGDVVVARLPARPLAVKRARFHDAGGWWLASDNPREGSDSATFGPQSDDDLLGRVVLRYWPRPRVVRRLRS